MTVTPVMRDDRTGLSKEFGFVSFSREDEAAKAQAAMDGALLGNRVIAAKFHEPKKFREARIRPAGAMDATTEDVERRLANLSSNVRFSPVSAIKY